jgi:hypothetical protein
MKLTKKILEQKIRKILLEKKVEKPVKEEGNDAFAPSHYCIHHGGVQHEGAIHQGEAIGHNWNEELGKVTHYDMKLADGTILEDVAEEDILVTKASLAEGSYTLVGECSHKRHGIKRKKDKKDLEENEESEIEEAKGEKGSADPLGGKREKFDKDLDGAPDGGDEDPDDPEVQESKIQTPEQENALYEQRFTKKNTKLFERLLKEWTK